MCRLCLAADKVSTWHGEGVRRVVVLKSSMSLILEELCAALTLSFGVAWSAQGTKCLRMVCVCCDNSLQWHLAVAHCSFQQST